MDGHVLSDIIRDTIQCNAIQYITVNQYIYVSMLNRNVTYAVDNSDRLPRKYHSARSS